MFYVFGAIRRRGSIAPLWAVMATNVTFLVSMLAVGIWLKYSLPAELTYWLGMFGLPVLLVSSVLRLLKNRGCQN